MISNESVDIDFGPLLGELKSTSERVQVIICLAGLVPFGTLWFLGIASTPVLFVGMFGTIVIGHLVSLRLPFLRSHAHVHENGMELNIRGKEYAFEYNSLTCISSKHIEHVTKYGYVGTRFEWSFEIDGSFQHIFYEGECHRAKQTAETVALAEKKCSEGVERRLLAELKQQGELEWRKNVFLTPTGYESATVRTWNHE